MKQKNNPIPTNKSIAKKKKFKFVMVALIPLIEILEDPYKILIFLIYVLFLGFVTK